MGTGEGEGRQGLRRLSAPSTLPLCLLLLTSPLQKQYMMATKNPCRERCVQSGPHLIPHPAPRDLRQATHLEGVEEHLIVHLDLP